MQPELKKSRRVLKILTGKLIGKPRRRWEDNVGM